MKALEKHEGFRKSSSLFNKKKSTVRKQNHKQHTLLMISIFTMIGWPSQFNRRLNAEKKKSARIP